MNTEHFYGLSLFDIPPTPRPRRPWLAAVLLVLVGCVLAGPREDSAAVARFRAIQREAVELDSVGRALQVQAVAVIQAGDRQLRRDLALQPGDTLRPDLTVVRKGPSK